VSDWSPPAGAVQVEPGCWGSNGSVYVDPVVWADWEDGGQRRNERTIARAERNRWPAVKPTVDDYRAQVNTLARELDFAREELAEHIAAVLMLDTFARRAA
jgi:hypothetical protein